MSSVTVEKVGEPNAAPASVYERMQAVVNRIRERAYDLFQSRGAADGSAMDDWLRAEQDVLVFLQSELIEKSGKFNIRVQVAGFSAEEVRVTAMPDAILVEAEAKDCMDRGEKQMFQMLDLPAPINPDKVTASLEDGILQLVAERAGRADNRARASAARAVAN
jgi:HSP20 family molecular chaperone IbpA